MFSNDLTAYNACIELKALLVIGANQRNVMYFIEL